MSQELNLVLATTNFTAKHFIILYLQICLTKGKICYRCINIPKYREKHEESADNSLAKRTKEQRFWITWINSSGISSKGRTCDVETKHRWQNLFNIRPSIEDFLTVYESLWQRRLVLWEPKDKLSQTREPRWKHRFNPTKIKNQQLLRKSRLSKRKRLLGWNLWADRFSSSVSFVFKWISIGSSSKLFTRYAEKIFPRFLLIDIWYFIFSIAGWVDGAIRFRINPHSERCQYPEKSTKERPRTDGKSDQPVQRDDQWNGQSWCTK